LRRAYHGGITGGRRAIDIDWKAWIAERHRIFEEGISLNTHIGLRLEDAGPGWARMRMDLTPEVLNPFGAAHGGATCALIDSTAGSAIAAATAAEDGTIGDRLRGTIDMQVHFLERARGAYLIGEGRVIRHGNAIGIAHVDVRDDAGALVAIGTGTFRLGRPGTTRNID
jgi:acyl-CoA thioesterase